MPFGGGGSSSSATNVTNVSVEVNPDIENNVIVDDSRLQAMVDAIVEGNEDQREAALVVAKTQVEIAKAQAAQSSQSQDKWIEVVKNAVITAVVGFLITQALKKA